MSSTLGAGTDLALPGTQPNFQSHDPTSPHDLVIRRSTVREPSAHDVSLGDPLVAFPGREHFPKDSAPSNERTSIAMFHSQPSQASNLHPLRVEEKCPTYLMLPPTGTFARAIMVESPGYVATRSINCAISLLFHLGTVLVALLLPLLFSRGVRLVAFNAPEIVTVSLPALLAVPGWHSRTSGPLNHLLSSVRLVAPVINKERFLSGSAVPPPTEPLQMGPFGQQGGTGDVLGGLLSEASSPRLEPVSPEATSLTPIGGDVRASRLISNITLVYPEIAKLAHVFGRVVIAGVIDETGRVTNVRAISGPLILAAVAIEAISEERFQPLLLNGLPTPCHLVVHVNFRLH